MEFTAVSREFKTFAMRSPVLLSVGSFLILAAFIRYLLNRPKRLNLPLVGSPESNDWTKTLIEGTIKVNINIASSPLWQYVVIELKKYPIVSRYTILLTNFAPNSRSSHIDVG